MTQINKSTLRITVFAIVILGLFLSGCGGGAVYYAPYHPGEHKVVLVLIPQGKAGTAIGRVLDRLENPPFRVVSIAEEECGLRSETAKLYKLLGRVSPDIASFMAKSVNATLVVYEDPDTTPHSKSQKNTLVDPANTQTTNFNDQSNSLQPDSHNYESTEDFRIAVMDVRTNTIIWHESLSQTPSESSVMRFVERLQKDGGVK